MDWIDTLKIILLSSDMREKKETVQLSLGFFLFRSFSPSPIDKKKKTSNVQALIRELSFFDQFYWSTTRRSLIFCSLMHVIFYSNVYTNEKSVWSKPTNIQLDHLYAVQMEISQTYRFPMDWFFFFLYLVNMWRWSTLAFSTICKIHRLIIHLNERS